MKQKTHTHLPLPHVADITCMDPNRPPLLPEKLSKTLRLLAFFIQNGVSKTKLIHHDMHHVVMKRGKNIGKVLNDVVLRHHQTLTCRPRDPHLSFVSPLEYQFSCSGSPPRISSSRRKLSPTAAAPIRRSPAHRAVKMCRGGGDVDDGIIERRVKISDSVASMLNHDVDVVTEKVFHVDEAADEFIARFYRELRLQKWLDHCY